MIAWIGTFGSSKEKMPADQQPDNNTPTFSEQAEQSRPGLVKEFWAFLRQNRKWWLLPLLIVLFLAGTLVVLASTSAGPFIYALF